MRDFIESNYLIFISSDGRREGYEIFKERINVKISLFTAFAQA